LGGCAEKGRDDRSGMTALELSALRRAASGEASATIRVTC
jgi:hypothetical protein